MSEYMIVKGYQNDLKLRTSFNELAKGTFGIDFEAWYQHGFWDDRYIPYSIVIQDRVVANVSVNIVGLIIDGKQKKGLQIGTVMTHPDYQGRGYSRQLMNKIFEDYQNQYDWMYLFANDSVLEFYPKFGFSVQKEHQFSQSITRRETNGAVIKLNGTLPEDLKFIQEFARKRIPLSQTFSTINTESLLLFYCTYVFPESIYYLRDQDVIAIANYEGEELHLVDVLYQEEKDMNEIIQSLANAETKKVVFHFTPPKMQTDVSFYNGSGVLFVKSREEDQLPAIFKHLQTAQA